MAALASGSTGATHAPLPYTRSILVIPLHPPGRLILLGQVVASFLGVIMSLLFDIHPLGFEELSVQCSGRTASLISCVDWLSWILFIALAHLLLPLALHLSFDVLQLLRSYIPGSGNRDPLCEDDVFTIV